MNVTETAVRRTNMFILSVTVRFQILTQTCQEFHIQELQIYFQ